MVSPIWSANPSLLVEHCHSCHGAQAIAKGNLRLDTPQGWLVGGDTGPAIVPGKPDESLLVRAIRYDGGEYEMPPTGRLPEGSIRLIEDWVTRGAPAPPHDDASAAVPRVGPAGIDLEAGRRFWAYQPPREWPLPEVRDRTWATRPIDRFVLARLEATGLRPQPPADRAALVRRLSFDLLGLPPTPDEIDAFLGDSSSTAYESLVDRLLASPHFGERWGRHWLDIVRYAESVTLRGFILPEAWRYRDYVIESFNRDRPYDQFLREQVAGDLLPAETFQDRRRQLVAIMFLTLGNTNLEEQDKAQLDMDVVDEQLDVLGKAFLGQTIGCARCHDHKFDPIPTADYYALAGILRNARLLEHANVSQWVQAPLPLPPEEEARAQRHEAALADLTSRVEQAKAHVAQLAGGPNIVPAANLPGIVIDDRQAVRVGAWQDSQYTKRYIGDGYAHDQDQDKGRKTLTFAPELPGDGRYEVRLAYTHGGNRADRVPVTVFSAEGERTTHIDMRQPPPIDGRFVTLGEYRFEAAGQSFVLVANEGTVGHVIADAVQFLPRDGTASDTAPSDASSDSASSDSAVPAAAADAAELAARRDDLQRLEAELAALTSSAPKRPAVPTVIERPEITDAAIHVRGSVHALGAVVPRGFLRVATTGPAPTLPSHASGRRELADWLADPQNPLTARVYANRVWHWLFGRGLVRTVDNFGSTGEAPSHPELLDHLALRFVEGGWSVKRLVREMVLSETYRQSSAERGEGWRIDPENRLYWRAHRRRLEAESLRDAMLAMSGRLTTDLGGPTIRPGVEADYNYVDTDTRRSVYVPVLRNSLPELFEVFDFPDPSLVVGHRNQSTVAPQALYLMNHPFVRQQAAAAARRLLAETPSDDASPDDAPVDETSPDDAARIDRAFRLALGRSPSEAERAIAARVLADVPDRSRADDRAWTNLFHLLFSSLDFRYRD
jgi:hypothetical protein